MRKLLMQDLFLIGVKISHALRGRFSPAFDILHVGAWLASRESASVIFAIDA